MNAGTIEGARPVRRVDGVHDQPTLIMPTFFCKLLPPRPTFALDMTDDERALMQAHAEYWKQAIESGHALVFGLVGDPAGPFGVGIVELDDERAVRRYTDDDPVVLSKRGFRYEILPMPFGTTHR